MPDVIGQNRNGTTFWIENKALLDWPKRPGTHPLNGKFEPGQLPWLRNWVQWGGHAFVLLRVVNTHYLLSPVHELGKMTRIELVESRIIMGKQAIVNHIEGLR